MESFFSRYKNGLVLLVVLLGQLIGLALQVRRPLPNSPDVKPVRLLRYWMASLITPPARVSHGAGRGVRGIWSNYVDLRHVREQNAELQAELERLRLEQGAIAEDARQGQRLQHLLEFKEHYIYKTATAQVIGTAGTDRAHLLIIDKGSLDGIRLDMPVITPDGVVGKVREVYPHSAQVLEISDQASGAGVMLETTRIRGVLRGNAYGQPQIINIMPDDRIKPGEPVVTSGGDQIYPRGLRVGVVDSIATDPERNPYVDVIIKPGANLARLEEVLVVTSTGDQLPPGEETDLAKNEALAQQHSAAEVLSEKLPSIHDGNAPAGVDPTADSPVPAAKPGNPDGEVARPLRPPAPLHADRFTPGSSPDAASSTPGVGVAAPPHVARHEAPPAAAEQTTSNPTDTSDLPAPRRRAAAPDTADRLTSPAVDSDGVPIVPRPRPARVPSTQATGSEAGAQPSRTLDFGAQPARPRSAIPRTADSQTSPSGELPRLRSPGVATSAAPTVRAHTTNPQGLASPSTALPSTASRATAPHIPASRTTTSQTTASQTTASPTTSSQTAASRTALRGTSPGAGQGTAAKATSSKPPATRTPTPGTTASPIRGTSTTGSPALRPQTPASAAARTGPSNPRSYVNPAGRSSAGGASAAAPKPTVPKPTVPKPIVPKYVEPYYVKPPPTKPKVPQAQPLQKPSAPQPTDREPLPPPPPGAI